MLKISVSEEFKAACPHFKGVALFATITNTSHHPVLWQEIGTFEDWFRTHFKIEEINKRPAIHATREGYKATGKDPNRYRPAAEALCRRVLRGLPLYEVTTAVDLINLLSLESGYSIGGFDADKIEGESLVLGIGKKDEPYEGIGRGELNIEGMPVYRDAIGGVGTPTSDNDRTKLSEESTHLLMIINSYNGEEALEDAVSEAIRLLTLYVAGSDVQTYLFGEPD